MKLEALIQNMTDQIKEAQLKLGYARETMRLYDPRRSDRLYDPAGFCGVCP